MKQVWLDAGLVSYHFAHADRRNPYNYGLGVAWRFTEDWTLAGGVYRNSVYERSEYASIAWQPIHFYGFRLGAAAGAIRGYPNVAHGGWSPLLVPVLSYEYKWIGANLILAPSVTHQEMGSISLQVKIKLW